MTISWVSGYVEIFIYFRLRIEMEKYEKYDRYLSNRMRWTENLNWLDICSHFELKIKIMILSIRFCILIFYSILS